MPNFFGVGAYGIVPFLSEDLIKQAKYSSIKTKAGRIAYLMSLGEKASKPSIEEGVEKAKSALKHISNALLKDE